MTLKEAFNELQTLLPGGFCLGIDCWKHPGQGPALSWTLWNVAESRHYPETQTLDLMVQQVRDEKRSKTNEVLIEASKALEDVF